MNALPTIFVKWQSDIDPATLPEDDIAFVFTQPTNGASRYQLSREVESSDKMTAIDHQLESSYHLARHLEEKGVEFMAKYLSNLAKDTQSTLDDRDETIASLRTALTDNEQLRESLASQIETQQARIVRLEAALKPFSKMYKQYMDCNDATTIIIGSDGNKLYTVGDLRTARNLLEVSK